MCCSFPRKFRLAPKLSSLSMSMNLNGECLVLLHRIVKLEPKKDSDWKILVDLPALRNVGSVLVETIDRKTEKMVILRDSDAFTACKPQLASSDVKHLNPSLLLKDRSTRPFMEISTLGARLKLKLMADSLPLNSLLSNSRHEDDNNSNNNSHSHSHSQQQQEATTGCPVCGHPVEDAVHFLIKCAGYQSARDALFQSISEHVPKDLFEDFSMLKSATKAGALISNVFWGSYGHEVDALVRRFLEKIWKVRDRIANLIFEGIWSTLLHFHAPRPSIHLYMRQAGFGNQCSTFIKPISAIL